MRRILGADTFGSDVLGNSGLDDRKASGGYLARAEKLMADAVGADHAFFSRTDAPDQLGSDRRNSVSVAGRLVKVKSLPR